MNHPSRMFPMLWIFPSICWLTCDCVSKKSLSLRVVRERIDSHHPCIPVEGTTALVIGQDFDSITNYTHSVEGYSDPFGLMTYTALRNDYGELAGTVSPIDYGSGVEWSEGLSKRYPHSSIQLGLWMVGQCTIIANGTYDTIIDRLVAYIKKSNVDYFLRIGYEFDSAQNNYPFNDYISAYQRIVRRFRSQRVRNVQFVWHAAGFGPRDSLGYEMWYPGPTYVDLCGVSLFQQPYSDMTHPDKFASFCAERGIPLMIAESTPYGGIVDEDDLRSDPDAANDAGITGDTWNRWFVPVLAYINKHEVRVWSYINCDWNSQDMWRKNHAPGEQWGDTRIEAHPALQRRWIDDILNNKRFVTRYPTSSDRDFDDSICVPAVDEDDPDGSLSDDGDAAHRGGGRGLRDFCLRVWSFLAYSFSYFLLISFIVTVVAMLYDQFCVVPTNDYIIIP